MAAAEAGAAWQRTISRCFVQEDAKRAPKLACCQSSSSSSSTSEQVDAGPTTTADGRYQTAIGFMPLDGKPSFFHPPSDTRWWLYLPSNHGFRSNLTINDMSTMDVENLKGGLENLCSDSDEVVLQNEKGITNGDGQKIVRTPHEIPNNGYFTCIVKDVYRKKDEVEATDSGDTQKLKNIVVGGSSEFVEINHFGLSAYGQLDEFGLKPDYPWIGNAKTEPWWRTIDKDDLASLVVRKSLDHVENCDLPLPQKKNAKKSLASPIGRFDCDEPSFSTASLRSPTVLSEGSDHGKHVECQTSSEDGHNECGPSKSWRNCCSASPKDANLACEVPEGDPSKAELLEALCHSQTRAREAEKAAERANAEKEHIIKLFFKQATQLFAYRQWFQLLQIEELWLRVENNDQPICTVFPTICPCKGNTLPKKCPCKCRRNKRGKWGQPWVYIAKYAFAVAVGLSLVGAGSLVGWTVGWILPQRCCA